ncbi:MAG: ribose 5-phosphate isomerase B [Rudaea sp.]
MKIALGADHGGYPLKGLIAGQLEKWGHTVIDCGAYEFDANDDYPDYSKAVGLAVQSGDAERGILICGSGVGAAIAANKVRGIRACLCQDTYSAHQGVEHDDMNVLCLGARVIGEELAKELIKAYLGATFYNEGRYLRRVEKIKAMEEA